MIKEFSRCNLPAESTAGSVDKRNASIMLNKMFDNLDKRHFMNRKDEKNESAGAKSIR